MKKILIADDNKDLLELMQLTLSEAGYTVQTVVNKGKLFSTLRSFTPDLIILDVFFDNADGREVCRQLRQDPKTSKIFILIISANPYAIEKFKSFGADDLMKKPFKIADMVEKIESLLK